MEHNTLASESVLNKVAENLSKNNFESIIVSTKDEALEKIKDLIPAGSSIMNGASKTLEEIGYVKYLQENTHGWNNLHEKIINETDPLKKAELRKQSVVSDFYLGSVHSLTETGEMIIASNTGSQLPHITFTSQNLIFVVGYQKISENLSEGLKRIEEYVVPLEDKRMVAQYGFGTTYAKTLILHKENPMMGRKIIVIIVKESLGF
jgi:hypothetical protein